MCDNRGGKEKEDISDNVKIEDCFGDGLSTCGIYILYAI